MMTSRARRELSPATAASFGDGRSGTSLTRAVVVGAIAVFLSVFGLTVAASQVGDVGGTGVTVVQDGSGQPVRVIRHVRTRSS